MNHLDTFSGIGGWALAARWMGWNTVAFVEKEKFCHRVLNKNFPGTPIHDDIFTFSGKPFHGRVDILTGSTPCQPFSQAGKRAGSNDERHLFPEFLRVVAEVEPRWIIIENVYGLLSIESGQVFEDYHTSLESKGYSVQTVCIPASALNAPHRRDRLWIIAHSNAEYERPIQREHERRSRFEKGLSEGNQFDGGADATTHTLNGEHRVNGRPQSEADSIQGISGAKGLSGRVSGTVTDACTVTDSQRLQRGGYIAGQSAIFTGNGIELGNSDVTNGDGERLQGGNERANGTGQPKTSFGLRDWNEPWTQVAAELCRVDDVVPNRVDRLKSLGNAIVPQIAYEIFRAIEEVEKELG